MKKTAKANDFKLIIAIMAIVSVLPSCKGSGEECLKDYYLAGIVTDNSHNPLSDVQIVMHGSSGDEALLTITTGDGTYEWSSLQTRSWYSHRSLKFVRSGYITYESEPFTENEAGRDVCGSIILTRDAVLQSE